MPNRTGSDIKGLAVIFGPLFILFIFLSAFQYHNYTNNRSRVRRQLERRQDLETELAAAKLQSYVREITFTLDKLSASLGSSKKDSEKYEGVVRAFDFLGGKVERIAYFNRDGRKIYAVLGKGNLRALPENCRFQEFFTGPKMAGVQYLSPIERLEGGEEVIYFSCPVVDAGTGEFSGVVMAQASRASFAGFCKAVKGIDPDIRFAYYGQLGNSICLPGCLRPGCSQARKELMSDAAASEVVAYAGPGPSESARVVYYPVRIEGYRWYMASEMPLSLADGLAKGDNLAYSVAGAVFLCSLFAGGFYFRREYLARNVAESEAAYQASVAEENAEFQAERDKLRAVLDGVPDGIILLDGEGRVADANASMREIASIPQYGPVEDIPEGSPLNLFLGPMDAAGEKTVGEKTYMVIPAPYNGGGEQREVRVVRDISRYKSLEQKRQDMVSTISHDIKNPLTAIIGMSEWMANEKNKPCLGDDGMAAVEAINSAATRVLALTETLLMPAAEGTPKVVKTQVDIGEFIQKVIAEFYLEAKRKGVTIRYNTNDILVRMHMDGPQMMRALSNLINNSLRHTPEGGEITVAARDFRDYVTVSISDPGPGISKSDIPHLFEKNYKASGGKERARSAGLGLSIAKGIIEAHGGTIEFVSDERSPAMFVVRLPVAVQS